MEDGAHGGVVKRLSNIVRRSQQHRDAAAGGQAGGGDLRGHAACADLATITSNNRLEVLTGAHLFDELCVRLRRVLVIEAIHVGEQEERVRADKVGHERGETVVIAEVHLGGRHGVILIHDGHRAHLTQAVNGALGITGAIALADVRRGQQHLPNRTVVAGEGHAPLIGQVDLAHRGGCLLGSQVCGTRSQAEWAHTCSDGTRGHDDDVGDMHTRTHGIHDLVDLLRGRDKVITGQRG